VSAAAANAPVSLNFRPVLCFAPALMLASGQSASTGSLPTCSPTSELSAANLNVDTATGEMTTNPPPDFRFSSYASTPPESAAPGDTVLLPAASGNAGTRYVLGPAALTQSGVASATAVDENGQWVLDLRLTSQGSVQWDTLADQQFHAIIGVVVNGKVISAPITMPMQTSFTSFGGQVQIAAGFTKHQAMTLARGL
jgi:preprotein translocase subunit SecD